MRRRRFLASPIVLLASGTLAAANYPRVVAGHAITFPRDAGAHPAFRSEWWYITGWVRDADGNRFGVQVTFFRNRPRVAESNPSTFAPRQLLFAHAAIADPRHGRLRHDQRAAREGFELAGAAEGTTDAWIDDWSLKLVEDVYVAAIAARDFRFELRFASRSRSYSRATVVFPEKDGASRTPAITTASRSSPSREGRDRRQGRERQRHRLARPRMVERGTGA
jgi:Predicted secreted hydrolase